MPFAEKFDELEKAIVDLQAKEKIVNEIKLKYDTALADAAKANTVVQKLRDEMHSSIDVILGNQNQGRVRVAS